MALQEIELRLSELNTEIDRLFKERESVLREWYAAFNTENPEGIDCEVENIEDICYKLYLVNGDSRIHVCALGEYEFKYSTEEFYKHIDNTFKLYKIANGIDPDTPEYQKNLIYAKAIEIREDYINRVIEQSLWPEWTHINEIKPFSAHVWLKNPLLSSIPGMGPYESLDFLAFFIK